MTKLRYVAYIRKSTEDEERQVLSLSSQKDKAKQRFPDIHIVKYLEESKSAFEPNKRPVFQQMLDMLDKGEIDGIVAWHPDRLSRNEVDASAITWRIRKGIIKDLKFASGFTFENTPEGMMMLQMTMSQSQYFSAKLSKDIRRGNEKKRELGGLTGRAHEGYLNDRINKTVVIDPDRFPLIRKAFDMYLTGEYSVQAILKIMNDEWGYKTLKRSKSGGTPLSRSSLYYIFRNVRNAGLVPDPYDPERFHKADFPAMITMEEYDKVQMLLGRKGLPRLASRKQFALRGFIRCADCDCTITAQTKKKQLKSGKVNLHTYYHCTGKRTGCSQKSIYVKEDDLYSELMTLLDSYELDTTLYDWAMDAFRNMAEQEALERNSVQVAQSRSIINTQEQLDRLLDMATRGLIDDDDFKAKSETLKKVLKDLQEEQADNAYRVKNWYEFVTDAFEKLTYAGKKFTEGDLGHKRDILLAIGKNPTLLDGKLQITPEVWLLQLKNNVKPLRARLEKVRTESLRIQKASEEAIRLDWCRVKDSNLRRHKPADLQSAVFDRFTNPARITETKPTVFSRRAGKMEYILSGCSFSLITRFLIGVPEECFSISWGRGTVL
jgi:site-specific DNA recombinase